MTDLNVREVSFRRKWNLGNYETLDIEFVATVGEDQDFRKIARELDKETQNFMDERSDK